MEDFINIILPGDISENDLKDLQNSIKEVESIESVDQISTRSLNPENVMLWVQVAGSILTLAGTATTTIKKVKEIIHKKKLTNVKLKLPKNIEISIDNASAEDLQKIIKSLTKE